MHLFAIDEQTIDKTVFLCLILIPAMLFRAIGDSVRCLLQALGYMNSLGFSNLLNIIIFFPYAYLLMTTLDNSLLAYGVAIGLYEFTGLIQCFVFYYFVIDKKLRNSDFSVFEKMGWYAFESFKNTSASYYNWIANEALLLIITITKNKPEIAAFSILVNFFNFSVFMALGLCIEPRNIFNSLLKEKKFKHAMTFGWSIFAVSCALSIVLGIAVYIFVPLTF